MTEGALPRVGVISDSALQLFELQTMLIGAGYPLAVATEPARLISGLAGRVMADVWLVCLTTGFEVDDLLVPLLETDVPVLIEDAPVAGRCRDDSECGYRHQRILGKLRKAVVPRVKSGSPESPNPLLARAQEVSRQRRSAHNVWVLGASLGGPEAMLEFLAHIPKNLPVSFVYAQHIDDYCAAMLCQVLSRNTDLKVQQLEQSGLLVHGQLGVVPIGEALEFGPLGRVSRSGKPWAGSFAPSIDEVITGVAEVYRECAGAVIFSGMGDDGAAGSARLRELGGQVWVQSPESCICPAMPEAVLERGDGEFSATPRELAEALLVRYEYPITKRSE